MLLTRQATCQTSNTRHVHTEHGLEELIGAVTHQPVSKTVQQASHEASKATAVAATTAGAVGRAVASERPTCCRMCVPCQTYRCKT